MFVITQKIQTRKDLQVSEYIYIPPNLFNMSTAVLIRTLPVSFMFTKAWIQQ